MNLSLLDPFQNDYPEVIEEYLDHGIAKCIAFNRRGTLLAAGCIDGTCIIWDFDTRGVAKELQDKECTSAITDICWSKCGRQLLTAMTDKSLTLWDVQKGVRIRSVTLQHTAIYARLHPRCVSTTICLSCPMSTAPILVDFTSGTILVLPISAITTSEVVYNGCNSGNVLYSPAVASFNKRGDLIYVGNSKGEILMVETVTRRVLGLVQVPGCAVIRQIAISWSDQYVVTNSNDRVIRVFEKQLPSNGAAKVLADMASGLNDNTDLDTLKKLGSRCLTFSNEFQDAVNRMHWKAACFNNDGEYVVGASASKGEHKIHVWNRKFGQLVKILEGPKEGLADLAWHPTRPILASVSMAGVIYLWGKDYTENWSAFAPNFEELDENEEYVEREDEFDIMPDIDKVKPSRFSENEEVDIMATHKVAAYSDSDNSQDGVYFMPTIPLPDSPEQETPLVQSSDSPAKPHNSSPSESERSPFEDDVKVVLSEPDNYQASESPAVATLPENEDGSIGRAKRKRKLSVKALEYEADKGQRLTHRSRAFTPRSKVDKHAILAASTDNEEFAAESSLKENLYSQDKDGFEGTTEAS